MVCVTSDAQTVDVHRTHKFLISGVIVDSIIKTSGIWSIQITTNLFLPPRMCRQPRLFANSAAQLLGSIMPSHLASPLTLVFCKVKVHARKCNRFCGCRVSGAHGCIRRYLSWSSNEDEMRNKDTPIPVNEKNQNTMDSQSPDHTKVVQRTLEHGTGEAIVTA